MRRWFATGILCCITLLAAEPSEARYLARFEGKPLPTVTAPRIIEKTLSNGMRCFLLEDHALPMVQMSIIAKAGSIYEAPDKVGTAALAGMLLRSGGAGDLSPEDFDAAVDGIGAVLSSSVGTEMGEFGLQVLSDDLERGIALFFDMIFRPRLEPARLDVARLKLAERLRREDDDPDALAGRLFLQLVYGKESPWARRPDVASLGSIGVDDIRFFHQRFISTPNLLLAAAGDFHAPELLALLEKHSQGAPSGNVDFPGVAPVEVAFLPAEETVVRPMTQSFIRMGHLGIRRHNPDKFALILMNDILGAGSFKSRLMEDIRTQRGMAYSIWSDLPLGTDYGLFVVGVDTKAQQASEVIQRIRQHLERLAKDGDVTPEELDFARTSVLARQVFEFDSSFKAVSKQISYLFYGYPPAYWKIFRDRIAGVTRADVRRVARRYLHPEGLKTVVVGPRGE